MIYCNINYLWVHICNFYMTAAVLWFALKWCFGTLSVLHLILELQEIFASLICLKPLINVQQLTYYNRMLLFGLWNILGGLICSKRPKSIGLASFAYRNASLLPILWFESFKWCSSHITDLWIDYRIFFSILGWDKHSYKKKAYKKKKKKGIVTKMIINEIKTIKREKASTPHPTQNN